MLKFLFYSIMSLLIICGIAIAILQTETVQDYAYHYTIKQIEEATDSTVRVGKIRLNFPLRVSADHLELIENGNVWLSVNQIDTSISITDLFFKHIKLDFLNLRGIHLGKKMSSSPQIQTYKPYEDPKKPVYINIQNLRISELSLDQKLKNELNLPAGFADKNHPLYIKGEVFNYNMLSLKLLVQEGEFTLPSEVQLPVSDINFIFDYRNSEANHLGLIFSETPGGPLSKLLKLEDPYSLYGNTEIKGPAESWNSIFNKKIQFQTFLEGSVYLRFDNNSEKSSFVNDVSFKSHVLLKQNVLRAFDIDAEMGPLAIKGNVYASENEILDGSEIIVKIIHPKSFKRLTGVKLASQSKLACKIFGPYQSLNAKLQFDGDSLKFNKAILNDVSQYTEAHFEDNILSGKLDLTASKQNQPIHLTSNFNFKANEKLDLENIRINFSDTNIFGNVQIELPSNQMNGTLEGDSKNLAIFNEFHDHDLQGSASFKSSFEHQPNQKTVFDVSLKSPNLQFNALTFEEVDINASITDLKNNTGSIHTSISKLKSPQATIEEIEFTTSMTGEQTQWPYTLAIKKIDDQDLALHAMGSWYARDEDLEISFNTLEGLVVSRRFQLAEFSKFEKKSDLLTLTPFKITFEQGFLYADFDIEKENLQGVVKLHDIPINFFHPLTPSFPATGKSSIDISLAGTFSDPTAKFAMDLNDVRIQESGFEKVPALNGAFEASLFNQEFQLDGKITGISQSPIEINAKLPMKLTLAPLDFGFDKNSPIALHVLAAADIAPLLKLFSTGSTNIIGKTKIALNVSGTIENPNIQGQAEFLDGTFEDHETGAIFTHLHALLEGDGSTVKLKELSGVDTNKGRLSGAGFIDINPAKKFPYEIDLAFDNTQFVRLDFAKALGSGRLKLTGNSDGGLVRGKINADEIAITIPEQVPALMESVEITYVNQPLSEQAPTQIVPPKESFPLTLDIEMDVAKNAKVNDENLTSEWRGNIKMTGTTMHPLINGEFKILQGQYMFNGKAFKISQGTIAFNGPPDKTTLYIITAYDLNNIVAEVILKGPLKNPAISFRSNPPMSQREILSYILFGRGFSELSPGEGSQISHSIKNLNSNKQAPDVLSKIKNTIGIDRIDISRSDGEANDVSVQVGKYISRGVFVYVNRSITAGSNRLAIEAEVMHNIKLQAEVGDGEDSDSSVLFKWKHDY